MSNCNTIPTENNNLQGWILACASGMACCLGASAVFADLFFQKFLSERYFQTIHNPNFLVASMSLGAGVMLFSSLYTLLHEANVSFILSPISKEYAGIYVIAFYFSGVIGSAVINRLIHHFVLEESSIHSHNSHNSHNSHHPHHPHRSHHRRNHRVHNHNDSDGERSPLIKNHIGGKPYCNGTASSDRHSVCIVESGTEEPVLESLYYQDHRHNPIVPPCSKNDQEVKLMRIGIQTALAISIHKFPEGLITFVSSQVSPTIGLALFVAIALHNIAEGFTIALPLYMATRSRIKSFLYASLLGGLSQPFGALIGFLFLKESELACWDHNFIYGILFAAVGGLMGVICIQGMLPQAIKNDRSDGYFVSVFFFVGVLIMGISSALFDQAALEP